MRNETINQFRRYPMNVLSLAIAMLLLTRPANGQKLDTPKNDAASPAQMKPYAQKIEHTDVTIRMVPIPAGTFLMGSPPSESGRNQDERRHKVRIDAFWMSACEITWEAYEEWMLQLDIRRRKLGKIKPGKVKVTKRDKLVDAVTRPTRPFTDMTFGMGKKGYPAICMTQHAARTFCQWLSARTGRYYRLPTEAEWEYACRAGSTTAYHFGDDPRKLNDHAWSYNNSDDRYRKVGVKKPNPWGLYDMHGNVAEWVLDQHQADAHSKSSDETADNPLVIPTRLYPRVVRGGSWDDDPPMLRSAARGKSDPSWKKQDPQIPKSIWYHTDALHVGFRIVRPFREPSEQEKKEKWEKSLPADDSSASQAAVSKAEKTQEKTILTPAGEKDSYSFKTDRMQGMIRLDGPYHGVSRLVDRRTGMQVIDSRYSALNLFKLMSVNQIMGQPRRMKRKTSRGADWVEVTWPATESHLAEITARYEVATPSAIDLTVTVQSKTSYRAYELFLSNYFDKRFRPYVYLWTRSRRQRELVMPTYSDVFRETVLVFPRDAHAARHCVDGRWERSEFKTPIVQMCPVRHYARCLAIMADKEKKLAVVLMSKPSDCYAISTRYHADNEADRLTDYSAFDLSLFGDDLQPLAKRTVKVRLALTEIDAQLSQPQKLYHEYIKPLKETPP